MNFKCAVSVMTAAFGLSCAGGNQVSFRSGAGTQQEKNTFEKKSDQGRANQSQNSEAKSVAAQLSEGPEFNGIRVTAAAVNGKVRITAQPTVRYDSAAEKTKPFDDSMATAEQLRTIQGRSNLWGVKRLAPDTADLTVSREGNLSATVAGVTGMQIVQFTFFPYNGGGHSATFAVNVQGDSATVSPSQEPPEPEVTRHQVATLDLEAEIDNQGLCNSPNSPASSLGCDRSAAGRYCRRNFPKAVAGVRLESGNGMNTIACFYKKIARLEVVHKIFFAACLADGTDWSPSSSPRDCTAIARRLCSGLYGPNSPGGRHEVGLMQEYNIGDPRLPIGIHVACLNLPTMEISRLDTTNPTNGHPYGVCHYSDPGNDEWNHLACNSYSARHFYLDEKRGGAFWQEMNPFTNQVFVAYWKS